MGVGVGVIGLTAGATQGIVEATLGRGLGAFPGAAPVPRSPGVSTERSTSRLTRSRPSSSFFCCSLSFWRSSSASSWALISRCMPETVRLIRPIHIPAVRAALGRRSGPSTSRATTPMNRSSRKPMSNMAAYLRSSDSSALRSAWTS